MATPSHRDALFPIMNRALFSALHYISFVFPVSMASITYRSARSSPFMSRLIGVSLARVIFAVILFVMSLSVSCT